MAFKGCDMGGTLVKVVFFEGARMVFAIVKVMDFLGWCVRD